MLAKGKGVLGDWESEGSRRQSAGATTGSRYEAASPDEQPLYVRRWLQALVELADGQKQVRALGTPRGGVISPLLANLFLHYVFDKWMQRHHPDVPFERYADDVLCHCRTRAQAEAGLGRLTRRFAECGLTLRPERRGWCTAKTMIDAATTA